MTQPWDLYLSAAAREYDHSLERPPRLFPHYSEGGRWQLLDVDATSSWQGSTYEHGNWTAGFWFGNMWLATLGSGDERYADLARQRLPLLVERAKDATTHDLGFLFYPSFVLGFECGLLSEADVEPALEAARTTVRRFNEPGRYIQAFGPVGEAGSAETSTIDTMMNLPLLWWAHSVTGESRFLEVARQHARTSARLLVRPDSSTIHLMLLDPVSGAFRGESTLQGAAADSAWSRGQAWAVAGLAWAFAVTDEPEFLSVADRTAEYVQQRSGVDELPPWDFGDPAPEPVPDASAAAVLALGHLILARTRPDEAARARSADAGRSLLATIGRLAINTEADVDGILLRSNYSVPHGRGVDGATAWGDFYVGLALALAEGLLPLDLVLGRTTRARRGDVG